MSMEMRNSAEQGGDGYLRPPWVAYPQLPAGDYGWRTEPGETYLARWVDWFYCLSDEQRRRYRRQYPTPLDWPVL